MSAIPTAAYLDRFRSALVSEIKAEMGRRDLTMRSLAGLLGQNHQYVAWRLGAGNPRTGKRVELSGADLMVIASAFNLDPQQLLDRALAAAAPEDFMIMPDTTAGIAATEADLRADRDSGPLRALRRYFGSGSEGGEEHADELELRRTRRVPSDPSPTVPDEVTDEELIGLPSVAEPDRDDVEGEEDPEDP